MSNFHPVSKASEIPIGKSKLFEVSGKMIALFHTVNGYLAVDDRCPHRGGPLSEGDCKEGIVTCPWHQAKFELRSGQCLSSAELRVNTYPIEVRNGQVGVVF